MLYINIALEIAHLLNVNRFRVVQAINDPGREMFENTIILIVFSFFTVIDYIYNLMNEELRVSKNK